MKKLVLLMLVSVSVAVSDARAAFVADIYAGATTSMGANMTLVPSGVPGMDRGNYEKSATSYGAVLGVDIPLVRVEGEYNYIKSELVEVQLGMVNAYLKLFPLPFMKPYVGIGGGMVIGGSPESNDDVPDVKKGALAGQGMLGLQFSIPATPLYLDIEGRALYIDDAYTIGAPGFEKGVGMLQYDVRAKIRYVLF